MENNLTRQQISPAVCELLDFLVRDSKRGVENFLRRLRSVQERQRVGYRLENRRLELVSPVRVNRQRVVDRELISADEPNAEVLVRRLPSSRWC